MDNSAFIPIKLFVCGQGYQHFWGVVSIPDGSISRVSYFMFHTAAYLPKHKSGQLLLSIPQAVTIHARIMPACLSMVKNV